MHIPLLKRQPGGRRSVLIALRSMTSPPTRVAVNLPVRFLRTPRAVNTVVVAVQGKRMCRVLVLVLVPVARARTSPSLTTNSNIHMYVYVHAIISYTYN